jgi:hypothetical protein
MAPFGVLFFQNKMEYDVRRRENFTCISFFNNSGWVLFLGKKYFFYFLKKFKNVNLVFLLKNKTSSYKQTTNNNNTFNPK